MDKIIFDTKVQFIKYKVLKEVITKAYNDDLVNAYRDIPKTIIPSELGRYIAYFSKDDVDKIKNTNSTGKFLSEMFEGYINRYGLDITQTNDLCAVMYMLYPEIFESYKCDIVVDTNSVPGKTTITPNKNGLINFVENTNREVFVQKFLENLKQMP